MPYYPSAYIPYPFSGIRSGYTIHPYHVSRLYDEVSGIEQLIGLNPLNGFANLDQRISGIESGYWNLGQESVLSPLFIVNNNGVSILSGQIAGPLQAGFLNAVDWTSFNSRVYRAGDTITGGLTVLDNLSGLRLFDSGIRPVGFIINGGSGNTLIASKSDNVYNLKGLTAGQNVQLVANATDITVNATGVSPTLTFAAPLSSASNIVSGSFASATQSGFLTTQDWNTFNNKQSTISVVAPLAINGATITGTFASTSDSGFLKSSDFTTFNNKLGSAANFGAGTGVYFATAGTTLQFRTLIPGSNISFVITTGDITISATASATQSGSTLTAPAVTNSSGIVIWSGAVGGGLLSTSWDIDGSSTLIEPANAYIRLGNNGGIVPTTSGESTIGLAENKLSGLFVNNINSSLVVAQRYNEIPNGLINGSNKVFTYAFAPYDNTFRCYLNGLRVIQSGIGSPVIDFALSGLTQTFYSAPMSGSAIISDYSYRV